MKKLFQLSLILVAVIRINPAICQDYFLGGNRPYNPDIPTPEKFLGYPIGTHHTRYDRLVSYMEELARISDRASIEIYGNTYEYRPLIMLTVTDPVNLANIQNLKARHLDVCNPITTVADFSDLPVFINLGYNVHGNEPSSSEAAMLTAYTLVASTNQSILDYLKNAIIFIDPTINPDGRDRHTHWANMYKGDPMVEDPMDAEHNEDWPRGRTNHYWFDLNRDWLLGIHPESRGKLNWYHQWYPNVVTDFHEMGSNSSYFFEPMKDNGSQDPIMPIDNYTKLNESFARYFQQDLDKIGSLYFTKEIFDGTYPGYGSSYPDLQGGLGLLFEQASSRGHVQKTTTGKITFAFAIRNQFTSSLATIRAAVENKDMLYAYQQDFFKSALTRAEKNLVKAYVFGDRYDKNRTLAFIDKLLLHRVKVYRLGAAVTQSGKSFDPSYGYVVPVKQSQYRMVQTMFETYKNYTDSVFYDASAWSVANFYNMPYTGITGAYKTGVEITNTDNLVAVPEVKPSQYAYLIPWDDYFAPAFLYFLQKNGAVVKAAFKPFSASVEGINKDFSYGTLMIPVSQQKISSDSLYRVVKEASGKYRIPAFTVSTGYSNKGIDLGSRYFMTVQKPEALMFVGDGVSSYEAGEVWHLLDRRVDMPITKVQLRNFNRIDLSKYNVMVMVSGSYNQLDSAKRQKISAWAATGNTLITIRTASSWAIKKKLVKESLIEKGNKNKDKKDTDKKDTEKKDSDKKDEPVKRLPYVDAQVNIGKSRVGGAIFEVDLDITHPLAFGYRNNRLPVYRNSTVWIAPSKNAYATVARYTSNPHIDGFITKKNLNEFLIPSASLIVSPMGRGRAVLFADNPNFRGSWYGTNRLFLNALFFGNHISVPVDSGE